MDGHAAYLGGVIVDHGQFDWMAHADKFPGLTTPDESYHGVTYAEKFGREGAFITKATAQLMRDLGPMQNPQAARSRACMCVCRVIVRTAWPLLSSCRAIPRCAL